MKNNVTAVEWLVDQMFKQGYFDGNKPLTFTNLDHLQEQAKAMEKEQIINAWCDGNDCISFAPEINAEQYYKETYEQ